MISTSTNEENLLIKVEIVKMWLFDIVMSLCSNLNPISWNSSMKLTKETHWENPSLWNSSMKWMNETHWKALFHGIQAWKWADETRWKNSNKCYRQGEALMQRKWVHVTCTRSRLKWPTSVNHAHGRSKNTTTYIEQWLNHYHWRTPMLK